MTENKKMNNKKVVIIGGEGNGGVIANAILDANHRGFNEWECVGFLNDRYPVGTIIDSFPVVGNVKDDVRRFVKEGYFFINTILRIDGQSDRLRMFNGLGIPDERLAVFVHPMAYLAPNVILEPGCVIMPNVTISSNTHIGKCSLVMVGATIGHDNVIGEFCHVAAQACVGAKLKVGRGVHFGLNCTVRENLTIGDCATIGMGAVLTKNVGEKEIWAGNPAKFLRMAND